MRFCCRQTAALLAGALALGVVVFLLLYTGAVALVPASPVGTAFFLLTAALAGGGLLALCQGVLRAQGTLALADAWLCCGELAAVGGLGALFSSLLTLVTRSLEVGLYVGTALCFFFLFLFFGGLLCFLRQYIIARFCGC